MKQHLDFVSDCSGARGIGSDGNKRAIPEVIRRPKEPDVEPNDEDTTPDVVELMQRRGKR